VLDFGGSNDNGGTMAEFNKILWALDNEIGDRDFERLCVDLLSREGYRDIVPVGGKKDHGRDAEMGLWDGLSRDNGPTFFQFSLEDRWDRKLRRDADKVVTYGHDIRMFVFVTSQTVTGNKRDSLAEEFAETYGWKLVIYEREWLRHRLENRHQDLAKKYLGVSVTGVTPGRRIPFMAPNLPDGFVERPVEFDQLREALDPIESKTPVRAWQPLIEHRLEYFPHSGLLDALDDILVPGRACDVAVLGDAGVGKTRLVSEYQHMSRSEKRYQQTFSITANSEYNFERGLREVAKLLFVTDRSFRRQDPLASLRHFMASNVDWLMAIDNLDDIDLLRRFVPAERKGGHVLITIRPGNGVTSETAARAIPAERDLGLDAVLDVQSMTTEEGARFLLWCAGMLKLDELPDEGSAEMKHALAFSADVGGLPLMLSAAGRFIGTAAKRDPRYGIATFAQAYRSHLAGPRLRDDVGAPGSDYPDSAKTIVQTVLQRIRSRPELLALLKVAAFLPPDSIPAIVFACGKDSVNKLVGPLAAVEGGISLLVNEACDTGLLVANGDGTYRMHRVWQQVLRDELGEVHEQRAWAEHAIDIVWDAFPAMDTLNAGFLVEPEEWSDWLELAPLGYHALELIEQYEIQSHTAGSLLRRAAQFFAHAARPDEAIRLAKAAAKMLQRCSDLPSTELASCYSLLGNVSSQFGSDDAPPSYYVKKANRVFEHRNVDKTSFFYWEWRRVAGPGTSLELSQTIQLIRRACEDADSNINWLALQLPAPDEIFILNQSKAPFAQQWLDESFKLIERHQKQRTRAYGWLLGMQSDSKPEDSEALLRRAASVLKEFPARQGLRRVYDKLATSYMSSAKLDEARQAIAEFEGLLNEFEAGNFLAYCHVMYAIIDVLDCDISGAKDHFEQANKALTNFTGTPVRLQKENSLIKYCLQGVPQAIADEVFRILGQSGGSVDPESRTEAKPVARRKGSQPEKRRSAGQTDKVGRNDLCPCGSGKKFKKCCMQKRK